jgi:hypothetical protein
VISVGATLRTRAAAAAFAGRIAIAVVGIAVLAACGKPAGTGAGEPDAQPSAEQGLGNTGNDNGNGSTGSGNPTGRATNTASPKPSASASASVAAGPTIQFFKIVTNPTCRPLSRPDLYDTPIKVGWKVTGGATAVRLYLNGGLYGEYAVQHEVEVSFVCNKEHGSKTHRYEIKTVGGGAQRTSSLSATAITPP